MDDDAEKELWQMQEKKDIDEEKIGRENLTNYHEVSILSFVIKNHLFTLEGGQS